MKKFIARGASVAFLSAAAILPLAGGAQAATTHESAAATATWAHNDDGHHGRCHFRRVEWWESSRFGDRDDRFDRFGRFGRFGGWDGGWDWGRHRHHRFGGWDWDDDFFGGRGGNNVVVVF